MRSSKTINISLGSFSAAIARHLSAFADRLGLRENTLHAWREKIFVAIFLSSSLLGLIPLYSTIKWGIQHHKVGIHFIYVGFFCWLMAIVIIRKLPFKFRAWNGIAIYFLLGLFSLIQIGPMGSGRLWLFGAAVIASLLLGIWESIIVLISITAVSVIFWYLLNSGVVAWNVMENYSIGTWVATSVTQFFLCGIVTISLAVLVSSLGRIITKEQLVTADLREAHLQLMREIDKRDRAQKELQLHKEELERLVGERTAKLSTANAELTHEIETRKQAVSALLHLASGVAHNFNNVLMATSSNAQSAALILNRHGVNDPTLNLHIENVVKSAEVGREVAKRLSRFVTNDQTIALEAQPIDIAVITRKLEDIAAGTWTQYINHSLRLSVRTEPDIYAMGIESELIEVLFNLIKNSVEAMQGHGVINVEAFRHGNKIHITVEDNGPGVSDEIKSRIFQPFSTTKGKAGLGLGLAISRDIILALNGDLIYLDTMHNGASFTIIIPASEAPPLSLPDYQRLKVPPLNILLVEDESLVAMGLKTIISMAGHKVVWASSLKQARDSFETDCPDVVICDLNLGDGVGWDLAHDIMAKSDSDPARHIAFVVLTGFNTRILDELPKGIPKPFAVLNKPVDRQVLLQILAQASTISTHQ